MKKNQFAKNLRTRRNQLGWTRVYAAMQISDKSNEEVSNERFKNWELGRGEPDGELLIVITEVFGIDDLYLFMKKPISVNKLHAQP